MIIEEESMSPYSETPCDGMAVSLDLINGRYDATRKPGKILSLWAELRKRVGTIQAKQKPGMKFKTRAADEMVAKLREPCNELGILIYPTSTDGSRGFAVEDGTLAAVKLDIIVQSIEDGSRIRLSGFGLGADSQDKAGGKAGTYAFKQALLQALLANGLPDTDDTDSPIIGGVKRVVPKPKLSDQAQLVVTLFNDSTTTEQYDNAKVLLTALPKGEQLSVIPSAKLAKARCNPQPELPNITA